MCNCNQPEHAIPGIMNPIVPVNSNNRKFSNPDGSINFEIHRISKDDPTPEFKIYIYIDYLREKEILFADLEGNTVSETETETEKIYNLNIDTETILLARGTYTIEVIIVDDNISKKWTITIRTSPQLPNIADYKRDSCW